jgi:glycogen synthase
MDESKKERPEAAKRTVVFVTFETRLAPSGGLGAVMKVLPNQMAAHERCCVLAPYFPRIAPALPILTTFTLPLPGGPRTVEIREVRDPSGFATYLLSSDGFFTAPVDPYVNPLDPDEPMDPYINPVHTEKLVGDALFFCAAVPGALVALSQKGLGSLANLVFHLQDWETACAAQAIRLHPAIESAACVLTLHNPYDRYLGMIRSQLIGDLVSHLGLAYDNVLAQMIPLTDGPVTTVSRNFAEELTADPLHSQVFTQHLQHLLVSKGVIGIDNGLFGELSFPFSLQALEQARRGHFEGIQEEKWERRRTLGQELATYQRQLKQENRAGRRAWGADLDLTDPQLPVFLVLGRDDPRQKGYDVVAEAIRRIPEGKARYIFTPMPGDEGFLGLAFLEQLAKERPGEVKVFPFRLDPAPFEAVKEGSSFMVMASLYEPFGAATEAYLAGMPVVARATGGLAQQVVPHPSAALSRQGRQLVSLFHDRERPPTGFLFREPAVPDPVQDWRWIVECAYWQQTPKGDRVENRKGLPLFEAMVQRAAWALQDAIDLYQQDQRSYAAMIYHGTQMLEHFDWLRAIREYRRIYDRVCK